VVQPHKGWYHIQQALITLNAGVLPTRITKLQRHCNRVPTQFLPSLRKKLPAVFQQSSLWGTSARLAHIPHLYLYARTALILSRPSHIIIYASFDPVQAVFAHVAKTMGIPVVWLQHGLECDPVLLDYNLADMALTWGTAHAKRLQQHNPQLQCIVAGNPDLIAPQQIKPKSIDRVIWITRPHHPSKCYTPSQTTSAGIEIARALVPALQQHNKPLLIKPHPFEDITQYSEILSQVEHEFHTGSITELDTSSSLILGEDSTATLEMAAKGRRVGLTHFASHPPIVQLNPTIGVEIRSAQDLQIEFPRLLAKPFHHLPVDDNVFLSQLGDPSLKHFTSIIKNALS
jgi:hypothetical protein